MVIKLSDICEQADKLAPGHRACSGCAETIVVRQVLQAINGPVVVGVPTGCLEVVTTPFPYTAWRVPWVHNLFENAATTIAGAEAACKVLVKKGVIKDRGIKFVVFAGDGATYDIGLNWLSGVLERGHRLLYMCLNNEAYMNCLSTSSLIMTKEGLKPIKEVREADEIYAFDQISHKLVLKKCTGVFDNGEREIFELKTLHHHTIRATPNHPFLSLKRNGRRKKNELVWKTLSELKAGEEIVVSKNLDGEKSFEFNFNPPRHRKATRSKKITLPQRSSSALMEYLGIWVGDGWVRPKRGETGFALPAGSEGREKILELCPAIFGIKMRINGNYMYAESVDLARFIDSLGFGRGAKNKTIPPWIFILPKEEKEAFIKGLVLSDGYKVGNSSRYVSASFELLRRLRSLLQTMGYRVGKIHVQRKKRGSKCVHRKLLRDAEYGCLCFSKRRKWNVKKYPSQYRYQNFLIGNRHFEMEKVKEIKPVGEGPTLDLRVEDEHNFIADGIVVHNTGIQRSGATPLGTWTTTTPVGKVLPGKPQHRKDLTGIISAHNIPYVAQAAPHAWRDLMSKVQKAITVEGPSFINVLAPCPRGWRYDPGKTIAISRLSAETCMWPLFEIEHGTWKLNLVPRKKKSVTEWLKSQGRFAHLLRPENKHIVKDLQRRIDQDWKALLERSQATD